MKTKAIVLLTMMGCVAFASQDAIKFVRSYKQGESDKYTMNMDMSSAMGEISIKMAMTQTVKKVYDNGDCDMETAVTSLSINAMGNEMSPPAPEPTVQKMNKFGSPVGTAANKGRMGNFDFMKYANALGDKGIKVGETVNVDYKDPDNKKKTTKGTVKLESVTDGVGKLVINLEVTNDQTAEGKPMKVAMVALVIVANGKASKIDGTITNLPNMGGGPEIEKAVISMALVK